MRAKFLHFFDIRLLLSFFGLFFAVSVFADVDFIEDRHIRLHEGGYDHKDKNVSVDFLDQPYVEFRYLYYDNYGVEDRMAYVKVRVNGILVSTLKPQKGNDGDNDWRLSRSSEYGFGDYDDCGGYVEVIKDLVHQKDLRKESGYGDLEDWGDCRWAYVRWYCPSHLIGQRVEVSLEYFWDRDSDCGGNYSQGGGDHHSTVNYQITVSPPRTPSITIERKSCNTFRFSWRNAEWSNNSSSKVEIGAFSEFGRIGYSREMSGLESEGSYDFDAFSESWPWDASITFKYANSDGYRNMWCYLETAPVHFLGYDAAYLRNVGYDRCSGSMLIEWDAYDNEANADTRNSPVSIWCSENGGEFVRLPGNPLYSDKSYVHKIGTSGRTLDYTYLIYHGTFPDEFPSGDCNTSSMNVNVNIDNGTVPSLRVTPVSSENKAQMKIEWSEPNCESEQLDLWRSGGGEEIVVVRSCQSYIERVYTDRVDYCTPYSYYFKLSTNYPEKTVVTGEATDPQIVSAEVEVTSPLKASQGIYSDKVMLTWSITSPSLVGKYQIYRRVVGDSSAEYALVDEYNSDGKNTTENYTDNTPAAGLYYEYKVVAKYYCSQEDASAEGAYSEKVIGSGVVGFIQPLATITGKIAYSGGNAVQGASAMLYLRDEGDLSIGWRSLFFFNTSKMASDGARKPAYAVVNFKKEPLSIVPSEGFTWQAWILPMEKEQAVLYHQEHEFTIYLTGNRIALCQDQNMASPLISAPLDMAHAEIPGARQSGPRFCHVSIVVGNGMEIYIDGERKAQVAGTPSFTTGAKGKTTIGNLADPSIESGYCGLLDEVRLWKKALTADHIKDNYGRTLAGNEAGLYAYWRLDEGLKDYFFDASFVNADNYNQNNGNLFNVASSPVVPSENQFWLRGITNADGSYVISGVPYEGQGTTYSVVPMMGTHQFTPSEVSIHIGANGATVQNGVDFLDRSSFRVTGYVKYRDSTRIGDEQTALFPVENAVVMIDGSPAISGTDGAMVTTDTEGYFELSVPVGNHTLSVSKEGHVFENDGCYPAKNETYNFQSDLTSPLMFYDVTRAVIAGSAVGGAVQNALEVGFGLSRNNIGEVLIELSPQKSKYRLPGITASDTVETFGVGKKLRSSLAIENNAEGNDSYIIGTEAGSGEYVARLLPEKYTVKAYLKNRPYTEEGYFGEDVITVDLSDMAAMETQYFSDSVTVGDHKELLQDTFTCNVLQKFVHYETPSIRVTDKMAKIYNGSVPSFGEDKYKYIDVLTGDTITIPLTSLADEESAVQYAFGAPVYLKDQYYEFEITADEIYVNGDTGEEDYVPVTDATLLVNNALALDSVALDGSTVSGKDMELPFDTVCTYGFIAGFPNINYDSSNPDKSFQLGLSVSVKTKANTVYEWEENDTFSAFVLGGIPTGNNFVTKGPDLVTDILRDPPGSASSATRSEGSTSTFNLKIDAMPLSTSFGFGAYVVTGYHVDKSVGTPFVQTNIKAQVGNKMNLGFNLGLTLNGNYNYTLRNTTTSAVSTGTDASHVGASGDVFVGTSTNLSVGEMNWVGIYETDRLEEGAHIDMEYQQEAKTFTVGRNKEIGVSTDFETTFLYSGAQIEGEVIPNLEELRNSYLTTVESIPSDFVNTTDQNIYLTTLRPGDAGYGTSNNDPVWGDDPLGPENDLSKGQSYMMFLPSEEAQRQPDYVPGDAVLNCNDQIAAWKETLARNEREKVEAIGGGKVTNNYSFDSGTSFTQTSSRSDSHGGGFSVALHLDLHQYTGFFGDIFSNGVTAMPGQKFSFGITPSFSGSDETSHTTTYTLKESNVNSYLSVDVYEEAASSPVFVLRGGQTACPYEGEVRTKYYESGKHLLQTATQKVENPKIEIVNKTVTDVPTGTEVLIDVKLSNNSEAGKEITYGLCTNSKIDAYGADITLEGNPLNSGINITIPAGQTVHKQIKFVQSRLDSLNYENIELILHSNCQWFGFQSASEVYDVDRFSVYFTPSCSDLRMTAPENNDLLNNNTGDQLYVRVDGFDTSYKDFTKIALQYRRSGTSDWVTAAVFCVDSAAWESETTTPKYVIEGNDIQYTIDMNALNDGTYEVRAVSECIATGAARENATEPVSIIKDMQRPQVMSTEPANGILLPSSQIAVNFNEPINQGALTSESFLIEGVTNGARTANNEGLSFDGDGGTAYTTGPVNLNGKSFTTEFWLQRNGDRDEDAVSLYATKEKLGIGYTADNKLRIRIGGTTVVSEKAIVPLKDAYGEASWQHVAVTFDRVTRSLCAYVSYEDKDVVAIDHVAVPDSTASIGVLYLGANPGGAASLKGKIRDVRIWNEARMQGDIYASQSSVLSGSELGLMHYWPMNEAHGDLAEDRTSSRHMTVATDWFAGAGGKAAVIGSEGKALRYNSSVNGLVLPDENFTLEFWFKSGGQPSGTEAALFSAGKGDGTDAGNEINRRGALSVRIVYGDSVVLWSAGRKHNVAPDRYTDGSWHHFALTVNRNGYADVLLDGVQTYRVPGNEIGGIEQTYTYLGVLGYAETAGVVYSSPFTGSIDEVRMWNSYREPPLISHWMHTKMRGDEAGLTVYYPFERYVEDSFGQQTVEATAESGLLNSTVPAGPAECVDGTALVFGSDVPLLRDARPTQNIASTYVASSERVVVNINLEDKYIEKQNLTVTASGIKDLNGNDIEGAHSWNVYVLRNTLKWKSSFVETQKPVDEPLSFTASVTNLGSKSVSYSIRHLPWWLSVSEVSGDIGSVGATELTFHVDDELSIGEYEELVYLYNEDNGIAEPLRISLKVYGDAPVWAVDPSIGRDVVMTILGDLTVGGELSADTEDLIGAFSGNTCIGVASPQRVSDKLYETFVFMNVYNPQSSQPIVFKVWDASTGKIYSHVLPDDIVFNADRPLGTPGAPVHFVTGNTLQQNMALQQGWNWVSLTVDAKGANSVSALFEGHEGGISMIKSQSGGAIYQDGKWLNGALSMIPEEMYKVKSTTGTTVEIQGASLGGVRRLIHLSTSDNPAVPHGWNWIGYTPSVPLSLKEAFVNAVPQEGEMVKSQDGFAVYHSGMGWIGSLTTLRPGTGYMYKALSPRSFIYPETTLNSRSALAEAVPETSYWKPDPYAYAGTMIVIAQINNHIPGGADEIGVFAGSELRGAAVPQYVDGEGWRYLLYVYGDTPGEKLTFRYYDAARGQVFDIAESTTFVSDGLTGSLADPFVLSLKNWSGTDDAVSDGISVYPVPADYEITVNLDAPAEKAVILDASGAVVWQADRFEGGTVNIAHFASGVYMLVVTGDETRRVKIIKQ
ncbi:MAG: T9SS type A sorting domain-containing protein [Bacteroidales bacterium]|nr:T9SS type A sorting domain-containing protein [Bacteroidales bacterium]